VVGILSTRVLDDFVGQVEVGQLSARHFRQGIINHKEKVRFLHQEVHAEKWMRTEMDSLSKSPRSYAKMYKT
jgi:hypothetical protein